MESEIEAVRTVLTHLLARVEPLPVLENDDTRPLAGTNLGAVLREAGFDVAPEDYDLQWTLLWDLQHALEMLPEAA